MVTAEHPSSREDEIRGQISGYWVAPADALPESQPGYRPTGAVLPRSDERLGAEATCLDLVSVRYRWLPLSEAGRYTYSHSQGLLRNERWRFVAFRPEGRVVYDVVYDEVLDPGSVGKLYGVEAASRCRHDRPAVQLRLRSTPTPS